VLFKRLGILTLLMQTATALGKLGHPDGELNLTRAAAKHGVIQMVSVQLFKQSRSTQIEKDTNTGFVLF